MRGKVIIATKNKGKAAEFSALLSKYGLEAVTLLDMEDAPDIEETGSTFEENAILKAEGIAAVTGEMAIADDSGLVIDALGGRPGIYSARYSGEAKDDDQNIDKVLDELKDVPDSQRTARFYCALAVAAPGKKTVTVSGQCEGRILHARKGTNGFGYDPIFFLPDRNLSMAELAAEEKNKISHRAAAMNKLAQIGESVFGKE